MAKLSAALSKELSLLPEPSRIMVVGEPDTGKSTLVALLARWFWRASQKVAIGTVERDVESLQAVARKGSYMVGSVSPYKRELPVVAGVRACAKAALREGADVILIDTCGLVKPARGVELKSAKATLLEPDLIITLSTPTLAPLNDCLKLLGFRVRRFRPLRGARNKSINERKDNRISCWNAYIGNGPCLINVDLSRTEIGRWWGEGRYVDLNHVPHGTVAAVRDPQRLGLQIPCIWTESEDGPSILAPFPRDFHLDTVWVASYRLGLEETRVISA